MAGRRKRNKTQKRSQTQNIKGDMKMTGGNKDGSRNVGDPENPYDEVRNQRSWRVFMYLRHPSMVIDLFISSIFRLQLFMYQKVAGRLPLFLKANSEEREQNLSKLNIQIKELTTKEKQLTSENNRLNESNKTLDNTQATLQEANEGLKTDKQNLLDERTQQGQENETLQTKNVKLTKEIQELLDRINEEENRNKKLVNKVEELDSKYKEEQNSNKKLQQTNKGNIETLNKQIESLQQKLNTMTGNLDAELRKNADLQNSNKKLQQIKAQQLQDNNELSKEITCKEEKNHFLTNQNVKQTEAIERLHDKIKNLNEENRVLEEEKQDALRRLSEQVSVKLRDNNPNIVDLSDQCRPTKLAEMFSELYDNEWTNAFSVLEDMLTEEQAIVVLLDTIMLAYGFCEERVNVPWQILTDWFLDEDHPGAQQTAKWLKDSRKTNIQKHVPLADKNFSEKVRSVCNDEDLMALLSDTDIHEYFTKCIELCLLMVATDPPVVLVCPGWEVTHTPETRDKKSSQSTSLEEKVSNNVENNTCLPAQQSQIDDKNQQTQGIKEHLISVVDVSMEEQQPVPDKSSENQTTDIIQRNESVSPSINEHNQDYSLQEHEQGKIHQQEGEVYDGTGTEDGQSIDEAQRNNIEKHHPAEAECSDESYSATHDNTEDSVVVSQLLSVGQQTDGQEPVTCDYEIISNDELTDMQQPEDLTEQKERKMMNDGEDDDNDGRIFSTTGGNMNVLLRPGAQEGPDDMESIPGTGQDEGLEIQETETIKKNDQTVQPQLPAETLEFADNGNDISGTTEDEGNDFVQSESYVTSQQTDLEVVDQEESTNPDIRKVDEVTEYEAKPEEESVEELVNSQIYASLDNTGEEVPLILENVAVANAVNHTKEESCTTDLKQQHNGGTDVTNEGIEQAIPITTERLLFDKELFKEYTRRGKYLDYIVWPALCLHKDGALLSKGVAQGNKEKCREQNDAVWTWRS